MTAGELLAEQECRPERDRRVQNAKDQSRTNQAELRNQKNREEQRSAQGAEIVEGEDLRDQLAELEALFENPHQQRYFQADQCADENHDGVENQAKGFGVGEGDEQQRR